MPELPEVETIKSNLEKSIVGKLINKAIIKQRQFRFPISANTEDLICNQRITAIRRRAKYLIIDLERGSIIIHLGMSGILKLGSESIEKHDHVILELSTKQLLILNDPRRFGCFCYSTSPEQHSLLAKMGPEPLSSDFNASYLQNILTKRSVAIKQALMNNHLVVGVGNIYANEALFAAKINPLRPSYSLKKQEISLLLRLIKEILAQAIRDGGTSFRNFRQLDGNKGKFSDNLAVYGRANMPCIACDSSLIAIKIGGRQTVYCSKCQI